MYATIQKKNLSLFPLQCDFKIARHHVFYYFSQYYFLVDLITSLLLIVKKSGIHQKKREKKEGIYKQHILWTCTEKYFNEKCINIAITIPRERKTIMIIIMVQPY